MIIKSCLKGIVRRTQEYLVHKEQSQAHHSRVKANNELAVTRDTTSDGITLINYSCILQNVTSGGDGQMGLPTLANEASGAMDPYNRQKLGRLRAKTDRNGPIGC